MKQYANVLRNILKYGSLKESARDGLPGTISLFDCSIEVLDGSVPILFGKEVKTNNVISELLWFLKGDTNIKYLHNYNNHIWDDDAYRWYRECGGLKSFDDWMKAIKSNKECVPLTLSLLSDYNYGDCGRIYGHQWRNQGKFNVSIRHDNKIGGHYTPRDSVDQIANLINSLIKNPFSRYHIVDAWNWQDTKDREQALPACHNFFQCNVRKRGSKFILDLSVWQRSCDMFLGVPYNLLSYGILHSILCKITGYSKGNFKWHGGDCHIYENQIDAVSKYLKNVNSLPEDFKNDANIVIANTAFTLSKEPKDCLDNLQPDDIFIANYKDKHLGFISAPLNTGANKWK